ncbi:MAG: hypothetical protein EOO69_07375 [Moraxellaceae bacterium]|nr:MAG: hypothetical protein EOO69_07375 [Moraxellaceae bacterium]
MKAFGILLTLWGCLSLYLSHPHQALLKTQFSSKFAYGGIVIVMLGLLILLYALPALVAVCVWVVIAIFIWSFIPFLPFFKRYMPDEHQK